YSLSCSIVSLRSGNDCERDHPSRLSAGAFGSDQLRVALSAAARQSGAAAGGVAGSELAASDARQREVPAWHLARSVAGSERQRARGRIPQHVRSRDPLRRAVGKSAPLLPPW